MSCMGAGAALKTAVYWSDRVVSALRNHVHYVVNYIFEGRRPGDLRGEVVEMPVGRLGADHRSSQS